MPENTNELKGSYKHYATYIFMERSRGLVRIDNYDPESGNAAVSIVWGEPDPKETQEKVYTVMHSGELLSYEDEHQGRPRSKKRKYNMMVE